MANKILRKHLILKIKAYKFNTRLGRVTMRTDSEIKVSGFEILNHHLGMVETEKFVALIQRERFDYTKWREHLFEGLTGKEISNKAMEFQNKLKTSKDA